MSVIYSNSTLLFLNELNAQIKQPHNSQDRHLPLAQRRNVRRLYENDTSKFEPILENREHLIKTLMPMVTKIAKNIAKMYHGRIEYDDCISAGHQGAIIATDIYISKSALAEQPAKLSTYAHAYIRKYINEYCYSVNSILSHETTKWGDAGQKFVMSGNQTYQEEGRSVEFFDIANDPNLMTVVDYEDVSNEVEYVSTKLFNNLSTFDKEVIFLTFGIGSMKSEQKKPKEIAKILKCSVNDVQTSLQKSICTMKTSIDIEDVQDVINVIKKNDLSVSPQWQRNK